MACAKGEPIPPIPVLDHAAVTVVMATGGYPGVYEKYIPLDLPTDLPFGAKIFHAGTTKVNGRLVSNGGRVLNVSAIGETLEEARQAAYQVCDQIEFQGSHYRRDIAATPV